MAISDEPYVAGLRRLEDDVAKEPPGAPAPLASEFVLVTITGDKAPL